MATLKNCLWTIAKIKPFLFRSVATSSVVTNWNKDWKPGPYPTTPEDRLAAAKKYGLRVEDYDVYPDDGSGYGDYPKIPHVSGDFRDPYEDWDYPDSKTNYGEVRHVDYDIITEDRWDPNRKRRYSLGTQSFVVFCLVGTLLTVYIAAQPYPHFLPVMPKQYPYNNLYLENGGDPSKEPTIKHYTFEPTD